MRHSFSNFNHNSKKYRFWCCHSKSFLWIWGSIELVAILFYFLLLVVLLGAWDQTMSEWASAEGEAEGAAEPEGKAEGTAEPEGKVEPEPEGKPESTAEPEGTSESREPESTGEPEAFTVEPETDPKKQWYTNNSEMTAKVMIGASAALLPIYGLADLLLLYGVRTFQWHFIFPHLLLQLLGFVLQGGMIVFGLLVFFYFETNQTSRYWWYGNLAMLYLSTATNFYVFFISLKCIRYLKDYSRAILLICESNFDEESLYSRKTSYPIVSKI